MTTRTTLGVLACLFAVALTGSAQPPALDTDAIAKAWQDRQDKVKTATFETKRTIFKPRGSITKLDPLRFADMERFRTTGELISMRDAPYPNNDYRATATEQFILDGKRIRYDFGSVQTNWKSQQKELYVLAEQSAFDGETYRELHFYSAGTQGVTSKRKDYPDANMLGLNPYLNTFRGRDKALTLLNPHDFHPTGNCQRIDGQECLEVRLPKLGAKVCHAWLSPAQGWAIVRITETHAERNSLLKQDRRYQPHPLVGWIPFSWEASFTRGGELLWTERFEVASFTINDAVDASKFHLAFKPGMNILHDVQGGSSGVIQDDGSFQPDSGADAYQLPGTAEVASRRWGRIALYLLLISVLACIVWRAVRRSRRDDQNTLSDSQGVTP